MWSSFLKMLARLLKFVNVKTKQWRRERITKRRVAIALGDTEEGIFLCDRKQRKVRDLGRENIRTSCWIKIEGNELRRRPERGDDKKYSFMCRISQEKVWGRAWGIMDCEDQRRTSASPTRYVLLTITSSRRLRARLRDLIDLLFSFIPFFSLLRWPPTSSTTACSVERKKKIISFSFILQGFLFQRWPRLELDKCGRAALCFLLLSSSNKCRQSLHSGLP